MHPGSPFLMIGDETVALLAMRSRLESRGYRVLLSGSSAGELEALTGREFSAVILHGEAFEDRVFGVVQALRAVTHPRFLPVIQLVTQEAQPARRSECVDACLADTSHDAVMVALSALLRARAAEDAQRESESLFNEVLNHSGLPFAIVDRHLNWRAESLAFTRLFERVEDRQEFLTKIASHEGISHVEPRPDDSPENPARGSFSVRVGGVVRRFNCSTMEGRSPSLCLVFLDDMPDLRSRYQRQGVALDLANAQLAEETAERQRAESQLTQAMKMDVLGKLTGGIAHDFNNLLTTIITGIDMVSRHVTDGRLEDIQRFADMALGSARRAVSLTHRLLAFSRQQALDPTPFDVNQLLRSLSDLLRRTVGEQFDIKFELLDEVAVVNVDANQLENSLINIVINARDAMPDGGTIRIVTRGIATCGDLELADGDYVQISVIDDGIGMDPEVLEHAFEPFFSTKPAGKGTGLGLSMLYGFARQSGGRVSMFSQKGVGTEVRLALPRSKEQVTASSVESAEWIKGQGETVLVVEDSEPLRALVCNLLTEASYTCIEAKDADEAQHQLRSDRIIDLLITDLGLPGMDGRKLAEMARAWRPSMPVLFITGYPVFSLTDDQLMDERMDVLVKPFSSSQLLGKTRSMLD